MVSLRLKKVDGGEKESLGEAESVEKIINRVQRVLNGKV